jgi:hypothetical protein
MAPVQEFGNMLRRLVSEKRTHDVFESSVGRALPSAKAGACMKLLPEAEKIRGQNA